MCIFVKKIKMKKIIFILFAISILSACTVRKDFFTGVGFNSNTIDIHNLF